MARRRSAGMMAGNAQVSVPPGFRFHPTDEELLYYYLRKKVANEAIDLDVIRDVDLNKLEPWDLKGLLLFFLSFLFVPSIIFKKKSQYVIVSLQLSSSSASQLFSPSPEKNTEIFTFKDEEQGLAKKLSFWEKCRIGSGPQTDWYFFSHKDKKYPTGTRTNRATDAGFWKATGRDKAIHLNNAKRIGMRKTLVFYTGRAPHGQKTDWIMHEYRLDDDHVDVQEDGWVVCRVFKKKNHPNAFQEESSAVEEAHHLSNQNQASGPYKQNFQAPYNHTMLNTSSMHLPQLLSTESIPTALPFLPQHLSLNGMDIECSQNLMRLTTSPFPQQRGSSGQIVQECQRFSAGDWSFLDKLLASHQCLEQLSQSKMASSSRATDAAGSSVYRLPFYHLGYPADHFQKFSK
ncbi:hypothetical protein ACLOJK_010821 [Asimina triloba]